MKRVLFAAAAVVVALTGVAYSKPKHTWFRVSYTEGKCDFGGRLSSIRGFANWVKRDF